MMIHVQVHRRSGSAVIVMLILLFAMVAFALSNSRALYRVGRELSIVEKNQNRQWANKTWIGTNAYPGTKN